MRSTARSSRTCMLTCATRPRRSLRSCVPPLAAEARFDTRRRNLAWGEKQLSKHRTEHSTTASISLFGAGHRTFRRGVELFDVTSNFSTWRRNVRCWTSKSRGEATPSSSLPFLPFRGLTRYSPPQVSRQNPVKTGFTFSSGTSNPNRGPRAGAGAGWLERVPFELVVQRKTVVY